MAENLPARAGDAGSIPGLGGAHRLWSDGALRLRAAPPEA